MTLAIRTYDEAGNGRVQDPSTISDLVEQPGCLIWVDVIDPSAEDLAQLAEEFQLHPLAMEDAQKHGQRPKLEKYPTHAFVVAYSGGLAEVDLFVGPSWLVSVRAAGPDGEPWAIDRVRARFERTRPERTTVGFLLYTFLDEIVDGYFTTADVLEDDVELFEDRVLGEVGTDDRDEEKIQAELLQLRRRLVEFRRVVVPLRDVLASLLRREVRWLDAETIVHLQDVYDHVLRATDFVDSQRELLGNAVDAHLAIISNRMNEVMKKMTSWGAILIGSTLVAGIYGMNFEHMPELSWRYGYAFALGIMAVITIGGFVTFRRRDWL